jgi:hypothetical protein
MNINLDSLSGLEPEIISMDDIEQEMQNDPNAIALNQQEEPMSIENIPDILKITSEVYELLVYLDSEEAVTLTKAGQGGMLYSKIDEKFPSIPFSIVKMLTDETETQQQKTKNVIQLLELLRSVADLKEGKGDIKETFEAFREEKMAEWVYPDYGGKEEFERKISEHASKDTKTLNRKERRSLAKQNKKLKK